jgi:hypothetical protein
MAMRVLLLLACLAVLPSASCNKPAAPPTGGTAPPAAGPEPAAPPAPIAAIPEARPEKERVAKLMPELVTRWNAVAGEMPVELPTFDGKGKMKADFVWDGTFPHPTFKGGTAEAYAAFAKVLLAFFRAKDNFEWLAKNDLFEAELRLGERNNPTLAKLAADFSSPTGFGNHDPTTRQALKEFSDRIKEHLKKPVAPKL